MERWAQTNLTTPHCSAITILFSSRLAGQWGSFELRLIQLCKNSQPAMLSSILPNNIAKKYSQQFGSVSFLTANDHQCLGKRLDKLRETAAFTVGQTVFKKYTASKFKMKSLPTYLSLVLLINRKFVREYFNRVQLFSCINGDTLPVPASQMWSFNTCIPSDNKL